MQIRSLLFIFILFALTISATPIDKRDALAGNYMIQLTVDFIAFFLLFLMYGKTLLRDAEPFDKRLYAKQPTEPVCKINDYGVKTCVL
jgi:hypothetical protein